MSIKSFTIGLLVTLVVALVIVFASGYLPVFSDLQRFGYQSVLLFTPIAALSFFFSRKLIDHSNPNVYTGYALVFLTLKIFFTLLLIVVYKQFFNPSSGYFVIPVLLSYTVFTVYECYFLIRIGK